MAKMCNVSWRINQDEKYIFCWQVKSAFTRAYNKESHLTPYSLQVVKKSRRGAGGDSELGEDVETEVRESEDEGDNLQTDAMIKVRKHLPYHKP